MTHGTTGPSPNPAPSRPSPQLRPATELRKVPVPGGIALQRSRRDLIATGVICAVAVLALGAAWVGAPVRHIDRTIAHVTGIAPSAEQHLPQSLQPLWEQSFDTEAYLPGALLSNDVVLVPTQHGVRAYELTTGVERWHFERTDAALCSITNGFSKVQLVFRNSAGCGEVMQLRPATGEVTHTRAAGNGMEVAPLRSNDYVGTVGSDRVELWRSDLVRTIEVGYVPAPQEPNFQPQGDCEITSALTRRGALGVVQRCPDAEFDHLRWYKAKPEDARQPEVVTDIDLKHQGRIVGIGESAAAVYVDDGTPTLYALSDEGALLGDQKVAAAGEPPLGNPRNLAVADLPHHMSWFDGERLYLFSPDTLKLSKVIEDAIGTGVAYDGRLLVPTASGIAVVNWDNGLVESTIPVDRQGYQGYVSLRAAGAILVEVRGEGPDSKLVVLQPA